MKNKSVYATVLDPKNFKTMPWKNGRGQTSEIAISPPDAGLENFSWRLSSAPILESGPFSLFPACNRLLTLLEGESCKARLESQGILVNLKCGEIFRFSGDQPVSVELTNGQVRDLGLVYQRDKIKADMRLLSFAQKPRSFSLTIETVFFYVWRGSFSVSTYPGEHIFSLSAGQVLRIDPVSGSNDRVILCEPQGSDCAMIAVELVGLA